MVPPPSKDSPCTAASEAALSAWLHGILAFREHSAQAPWRFYEELDAYLGPWGEHGYLLGYGKKYCRLFFHHPALRDDAQSTRWMEQTLLFLQQELLSFVMQRYRAGTLHLLSERELRDFAFDSHSRAYVRAGFSQIVTQRPAVAARVIYILRPELSFSQVARALYVLIPEVLSGSPRAAHRSASAAHRWSPAARA